MKANLKNKNKIENHPEWKRIQTEVYLLENELLKKFNDKGINQEAIRLRIEHLEDSLKIYKELIKKWNDSFFILSDLNAFHNGIPLTPIYNDGKYWKDITKIYPKLKNGVVEKYQNERWPSLYKEVYNNGQISYHDSERVICCDNILNSRFYFGLGNKICDEMFPITFPYDVEKEICYSVFMHQFLSDKSKDADFDTIAILYIEKPDGKKIKVDRYFRETNDGEIGKYGSWVEINVEELKNRIKDANSNLTFEDLNYEL